MFNHMSNYERATYLFGEEFSQNKWESAVGKFLIVEACEDNATRLFIRNTNPLSDSRAKQGWWDTFTITKTPQSKGIFIAQIEDVRFDKNGYPNFIINRQASLPDDFISHVPFVHVLGLSRVFLNEFDSVGAGVNYEALVQLSEQVGKSYHCKEAGGTGVAKRLVYAFCDGKVTIEQIDQAANSPTSMDIAIRKMVELFKASDSAARYPLLCAKVAHEDDFRWLNWVNINDIPSISGENLYWYIETLENTADNAVDKGFMPAKGTNESRYDYIERYFRFNEERKARNKAAKTAAKKAKKQAVKAANN